MTAPLRGLAGGAVRRALAGLALIVALAPGLTAAAGHLAPGDSAPVSAGPVLVRTTPGYDAEVVAEIGSGTLVTVADGPVAAPDGSLWYLTDSGGYVPAGALGESALAPDPELADQAIGKEASYAAAQEAAAQDTPAEAAPVELAAEAAPGAEMPAEVPAETPAPVPAPETASYDSANVIATAWVAGTDGDGAVCRAGMDFAAADLGWLAEGSAVDVIGDTVGEWQPVGCAGVAAFIHASFIAWEPPATVDASSDDNETTDPATTDPATVDASDDDVTTETATTDAVPVEATPRTNRERGSGESDAVDSSDDLDSSDDGAGNDGGGGGSGQDVADFAMQFEGYPYVYAGEGPYAFDCSGLTMFVIQNTLGKSITHDMFVQYDMGQQVDRSELQPGDLVFFQNTFRPGMSHNGIYIGGGQMIHAENESTGVKVSDINSDYYSSRWYGAVRFS